MKKKKKGIFIIEHVLTIAALTGITMLCLSYLKEFFFNIFSRIPSIDTILR